jgi:hypothetical protein
MIRNIKSALWLLQSLFLCVLLLVSPTTADVVFMGSQHSDFAWQASLDRATGLAASKETSQLQLKHKTPSKPMLARLCDQIVRQHKLSKCSTEFVSTWTKFLCSGPVTLGFFQAIKDDKGFSSLQPRWLPLPILKFGEIRRRHYNAWEIPIQGGFLSLTGPRNNTRGKLTFQVHQKHDRVCLQMNIVDYRPWLAGQAPVPLVRKSLYLSTQSIVHAYITWRFHQAWRHELKQVIEQHS